MTFKIPEEYLKRGKVSYDRIMKETPTNFNSQNNPVPIAGQSLNGFIYVPSIGLHVARERILFNEDFYDSQKELHSNNQRMPTIPEFIEFLKYTKENHKDIYDEITEVRSPWRAEWLDADFKVNGNDLVINYHIFDQNGNIVEKSEVLDNKTLMESKKPGISLEKWLEDPTKQGLPKSNSESGNLYYWAPMRDDNSVARFNAYSGGAGLYCFRVPSFSNSGLGVRPVMLAGNK